MINIPTDKNGGTGKLDDFLASEGKDALKQLLAEAKPSLFIEVEDIAALGEQQRLQPLRDLFSKLFVLEPVERSYWKDVCHKTLGITPHDFNAQIKLAKQKKEQKSEAEEDNPESFVNMEEEVDPQVIEKAHQLSMAPDLLYQLGRFIQKLGVAGEVVCSILLYLIITSRILSNPISATLKGDSAAGKSYIVEKVLRLFLSSAFIAITGMSKQALIYMNESFSHRTLIIYERPGMDAADYNIRTLQSEGRVSFMVVEKNPVTNHWETRRVEKEGPTNFICTTTSPELHSENETRHWTITMDESPEQTQRTKLEAAKSYIGEVEDIEDNLNVWRQVQNELQPLKVTIPYVDWLAQNTPDQPLRMRRDFPRLLALIEVVTILHQKQRYINESGVIESTLADYFYARELIAQVFPASLAGINKKVEGLIEEVQRLYEEKLDSNEQEPSIKPAEIAAALSTSSSSVSRWLRPAIEAGLIEVVSETAKGRIRAVRPGYADLQTVNALPTVEDLANAFPDLAKDFWAVNPITGEEISFVMNDDSGVANKNCEIIF